jgi:Xaa-Pro aminopeptidase
VEDAEIGPGRISATDIDVERLRAGRLARLQSAMRSRGVEACLFFNQANVRYATGTAVMKVYSEANSVRCAVVAAEGKPILFDHPKALHISQRIVGDVRPMPFWEFTDDASVEASAWASGVLDALGDLGVRDRRLAVDRLGTPAFLALQSHGIELLDTGQVTLDARAVKTPEELAVCDENAAIGFAMLSTFEASLEPGIREQDLLAVITNELLRRGGEYLISRACVSGPNTNPWNLEATSRAVEPGDLAFVDTDAYGREGYLIDVSRTFLCGDARASAAQRDAYRSALEWLTSATDLLRPGIAAREFAELAPKLPDRYLPQRYEVMLHSAGLEDEGPSVAYPGDAQPNPERIFEAGMVVCLETYTGAVGGRDGVKLEDQLVITADGSRNLTPYPFCDALM